MSANPLIKGLSLDDPRRSFVKLVDRMSHARRPWQIFRDFCELLACSYANVAPNVMMMKREARYHEIREGYEPHEMQAMSYLNACVVQEMERKRFDDVLGGIFMEMDLGSHWHGQFFTPYALSAFMARMTLDDRAREMEIVRWHEPACGAGAMMIAVAEGLLELGVNPQRTLHVEATDIDPMCCHMALIQLSVLGVPAVVRWGNTLSGERWDEWRTPAHVLGMWDAKLRRADARVLTMNGEAEAGAERLNVETNSDAQKQPVTTSNERGQLALF